MKYYSVNAVACSRGKTFDAEIAFTIEDGLDKRSTTQKVVGTRHPTHGSALDHAKTHVIEVEKLIETHAYAYLRKFKTAEA